MHIDAGDILDSETGTSISYDIEGEVLEEEDVNLAEGLDGYVRLLRTDEGLIAAGEASGGVEVECHRCLQSFTLDTTVTFEGEFVPRPQPEQWPLGEDDMIDIGPMIRQELIVAQPIKLLCRPDCRGLAEELKEQNGRVRIDIESKGEE